MVELKDKGTGRSLGVITEAELQFLIDHLEEESSDDRDYFLNPTTLDALAAKSTDSDLIDRLRRAMGDGDGLEIEWIRDE